MHAPRLVSTLCLLLVGAVQAEELVLIGRHRLEGRAGDEAIGGWIEVLPDATYRGQRRTGERVEDLAGAVAIEGQELVLRPARGAAGAVTGGGAERRYERDDQERRVRWKLERPGEVEVLRQEKRPEPEWWHVAKRLTVEGRPFNWLLRDNLGWIDRREGALILRSREPSPADIVRLQERYGLKTILSLNGDQEREETLLVEGEPGQPPRRRKVVVREFIAERGIEHVFLSMGAKRAPTNEELVAAFRVLVDDAKKPLLVHCQGGADRTGIIAALYAVELQGVSKADARRCMRRHMWTAHEGTEIQGAFLDLYQPGTLRRLLAEAGVELPARYARSDPR